MDQSQDFAPNLYCNQYRTPVIDPNENKEMSNIGHNFLQNHTSVTSSKQKVI